MAHNLHSRGKNLLFLGLLALASAVHCGASGTNVSITIQHVAALRGRAFWPHDSDWKGLTLFCTTVVDNSSGTPLSCFAPYRTVFDSVFVTAFDESGKAIAREPYSNPNNGNTGKPRYFTLLQGRSTNELFFVIPNLQRSTSGLTIRLEGRLGGVSPELSCSVTSSVVRVKNILGD
jgi:hypothetical protein